MFLSKEDATLSKYGVGLHAGAFHPAVQPAVRWTPHTISLAVREHRLQMNDHRHPGTELLAKL